MTNGSITSTQNSNTPVLQTSGTALAANLARIAFGIQNQGTTPLFLLFGAGASTSVYHMVLNGGTAAADGTGGKYMTTSVAYNGIISVASATSPSYTVFELAP